jgi:hypothetical protein
MVASLTVRFYGPGSSEQLQSDDFRVVVTNASGGFDEVFGQRTNRAHRSVAIAPGWRLRVPIVCAMLRLFFWFGNA